MFWKKKKRKPRNNLTCNTIIPRDDLWVGDGAENEIIRHSGLAICDIFARFLLNNNAMIYGLYCDYEHVCWVLNIKWQDKFFDLYIYNFDNLQIRITRSNGTEAYFKLIQLIHDFLITDSRFSEIEWFTDIDSKTFPTPF